MGLDVQIDIGDAKTRIETERMLPNYLLEKGVKQTRNGILNISCLQNVAINDIVINTKYFINIVYNESRTN